MDTEAGSIDSILQGIREGDKRTTSKLMSLLEDRSDFGEECLRRLYATPSRSFVLGITGWPGVGKSTLVNRIARYLLREGKSVGIIAVDPSSPFSGGSLLGDRERMRDVDGDERIFIRSMATRGHTGGVAETTRAFIKILEAMNKDVVILETVGVGQNQVSVVQMVDTVIVVVIPGMGDYLQSLKAGVLEIGDIYVVNKADRQGASKAVSDLKMLICLDDRERGWSPPILKTSASTGEGLGQLMEEIEQHRRYILDHQLLAPKRQSSLQTEIVEMIKERALRLVSERINLVERVESFAHAVDQGLSDPYTAAELILKESGIVGKLPSVSHKENAL